MPAVISANTNAPTFMTTGFPEALRALVPVGRMGELGDIMWCD